MMDIKKRWEPSIEKSPSLIHVYTGDGKGKTTMALGIAMRAIGHDYKVVVIQFMKCGVENGEQKIRDKLLGNYEIHQFGRSEWVVKNKPEEIDVMLARSGLEFATEVLRKRPNILVLDEINVAIDYGLIRLADVLAFLEEAKNYDVEIILTGRNARPEIIERAHLVTVMNEVKHPLQQGFDNRRGIDY